MRTSTAQLPVAFLAFAGVAVENYLPLPRLADEAAQLRTIFKDAERAGKCKLEIIENITLTQILDTFQDPDLHGRIAIFHFAGHADSYELLMEEVNRKNLLVHAGGLAEFLAEQPGLKLVFLNACNTEDQAKALGAVGIPAIIAATDVINDDWAAQFAARFYKGLTAGASTAAAFRSTVADLRGRFGGSNECPWRLHTYTREIEDWRLIGKSSLVSPWRVPFLRNGAFVGRVQDLADLHSALLERNAVSIRPTSLTGMGGIGKTQLAVEYCYRYRESYPGGILWVNAATDLRQEFADLGAFLDADTASEPEDRRIRAAAEYLTAHSDCLLVLDNVNEPSRIRQPIIAELILSGLPCHLLLTTRRRDLVGIHNIEVSVLPEEPALQLLLRDQCRVAIMERDHPEHQDAMLVCAILGYLPLALEIAGAHLGRRTQVALARYVYDLLSRGALPVIDDPRGGVLATDLGTRHRAAVAATLAEQWDALENTNSKQVLLVAAHLEESAEISIAGLGVLAGVFDEEKLFFSNLTVAVDELEKWSLVEKLAENSIRLHPLVRAFVRNQLAPQDVDSFLLSCVERLVDTYLDVEQLTRHYVQRGINEVEKDLRVALIWSQSSATHNGTLAGLRSLIRILQQESHILRGKGVRSQPVQFMEQLLKRAMLLGEHRIAKAIFAALKETDEPFWALQWALAHETRALMRTLIGHGGSVNTVLITSDGNRIVSGSDDRTVRIWDVESGQELHVLEGHLDAIAIVKATADGKRIISGSDDGSVMVWDVASGQVLYVLSGHQSWVRNIAVTKDDALLVSASYDGNTCVWDLNTGRLRHCLGNYSEPVLALAITFDGQQAFTGMWDGSVTLWNIKEGTPVFTSRQHGGPVCGVAVGRRYGVSASRDRTLKVWDLSSGEMLRSLEGHSAAVYGVTLTNNDQYAISASGDGDLRTWEVTTGKLINLLTGHEAAVTGVTLTPDGRWILSASDDCTCRAWNTAIAPDKRLLAGHTSSLTAIDVANNSNQVVTASTDGTLKIWNLQSGQGLGSFNTHAGKLRSLGKMDGSWCAVLQVSENVLTVWDIITRRKLFELSVRDRSVRDRSVQRATLAGDGRSIVSVAAGGVLMFWNSQNKFARPAFEKHNSTENPNNDPVNDVAINFDSSVAVSAANDPTLKVWDPRSGRLRSELRGHENAVTAIALSNNGKIGVSLSQDNVVKVWDLENAQEILTLAERMYWVASLAVTVDGQYALLASKNRILAWNTVSGQLTRAFEDHGAPISAVAPMLRKPYIISASLDNTIKVWNFDSGAIKASITLDAPISSLCIADDEVTVSDQFGNIYMLQYVEPRSH